MAEQTRTAEPTDTEVAAAAIELICDELKGLERWAIGADRLDLAVHAGHIAARCRWLAGQIKEGQ